MNNIFKCIIASLCISWISVCFGASNGMVKWQTVWSGTNIGDQIKWVEQKFNITPKSKSDLGKYQERVYVFGNCELTMHVQKGSVIEKSAFVNNECKLKDVTLFEYESSRDTLTDILKDAPGRGEIIKECASNNCGNASEPVVWVRLYGNRAQGNLDVDFGFYDGDGFDKWVDYVFKKAGGKVVRGDNLLSSPLDLGGFVDYAKKMSPKAKPSHVRVRFTQ